MGERRKDGRDRASRSDDACDRSRNERQKAVLLRELSSVKHRKDCAKLREACEKLMEKSRRLCEKARDLLDESEQNRAEKTGHPYRRGGAH